MKLYEIAHSRTGDKGNTANISLIVYDEKHFQFIRDNVTAQRVKEWFGSICHGEVSRYELPQLGALNFVLEETLGGGVTTSTASDKHGKSLSSLLLEMEI